MSNKKEEQNLKTFPKSKKNNFKKIFDAFGKDSFFQFVDFKKKWDLKDEEIDDLLKKGVELGVLGTTLEGYEYFFPTVSNPIDKEEFNLFLDYFDFYPEHLFGHFVNVTDFLQIVKEFWEKQPFFYNSQKIWFFWNHYEYRYEKVDETDLLLAIDKFTKYPTTNQKIKMELLEAFRRIGRQNIPKDVPEYWVQFKDRIINLQTSEEFNASSRYFITNPIPWEIGESEETPKLDQYFREWVSIPGNDTWVQTLYEMIAYSCMPKKFLQRLFALCGSGSNGKGVFLKIVKKLHGKSNCCGTNLFTLTENIFESSFLYKKSVCFMGEVSKGDLKNTNLLKSLSGEDEIRYSFKGKDVFSEESNTTIFVATNSLPLSPDESDGYYRRWLIVDFPHTFPTGKDILADVPDYEFNNLCKKIIRICQELLQKKYITNEGTIEERKIRYENRAVPLKKFMQDFCEENQNGYVLLKIFANKLNKYLKENHLAPWDIKKITNFLRNENYEISRTTKNFVNGRFILGLDLKYDVQDLEIDTFEKVKKSDINEEEEKPYIDLNEKDTFEKMKEFFEEPEIEIQKF